MSVTGIFLLFAVAFIAFQHQRERQYKMDSITQSLQGYNVAMAGTLRMLGKWDETTLTRYIKEHPMEGLRVTIIRKDGKVIFDSEEKDYANFTSHANRPEILEAKKKGVSSFDVRESSTLSQEYCYSATYFDKEGLYIRSALPYDSSLMEYLQADIHYVWFTLVVFLLLTFVLYRFVNRLDAHIIKLRLFAYRADRNESLETEDLADFPDDELGEIAERIVKIYKRLQNSRREQGVLKRQLTQNIAHELKTPVSSIQGYLETILQNPRINEETKQQFLQRCYAQSERLTALLRDISTLNRMDDAPDMMDFEAVDISALVDSIRKEVALQMEQRKMKFECDMPERLVTKGNRSLLYSIFRNLTDNAIAYAGEGTTITDNTGKMQTGMIALIALTLGLYLIAEHGITNYIIMYGTSYLQISAAEAGLALSLYSAGLMIGRLVLGTVVDRIGAEKMIFLSLVIATLVAIATFATSVLTLLFIVGLAISIVYPTTVSLVRKHAPISLGARATTIAVSAASILDVIFNAVFGKAIDSFGYGRTMPVLCIALAASALLMILVIPKGKRQQ